MDPIAELLALIVPPACTGCRAPVRAGERLCPGCRRRLPWLGEACPRCSLPDHGSPCSRPLPGIDRAWAPLAHEGVARAVVLALKYRGAEPLGSLLGAQLAANLPRDLRRSGATLVAVPAHPGRRRARGFDPVAALAADLGRRTGLPVSRCLRRSDASAPQAGRGRDGRLRPGRMRVAVTGTVPARVLLVDDVITTGATLGACATALRAAEAVWVGAVAYARAV